MQNWKIREGEQFVDQEISSIISDATDLRLLHKDGYAGQKFLRLSDKSFWEEVYSWQNGERSITTVKLSGTAYHDGRICFVSLIHPVKQNDIEIQLTYLQSECRKKIEKKGYQLHRKDGSGYSYIKTEKKDSNACLLTLNQIHIPFGHSNAIFSPVDNMLFLQKNGTLENYFLEIYYMCDEFTITRKIKKSI